jgi:hypothetical protein
VGVKVWAKKKCPGKLNIKPKLNEHYST